MNRICFYLDEDTIKTALIQALRNADLDVVTVADVNRLGYTDEEQLIWATEQKRVIYSFNIGDFCRLHRDFMAEDKSYTGIILASQQQYSVGQQLQGLLKLAADKPAQDMVNQLIFLSAYV
ncbi:DUF5615 family PIN-like protein [Aphanizomenon sp. CS-733/32]|uniref:DUF5615 family PIN-like protein n=1 Tax=Aphanizomenon sp. CS-733/32 TaxID=3021715 RepID=UPI00232E26AE|nr:DUF5615 family PIN-like protein [Aphanizomenon sp. CS-733/32]MDB9310413.1 DUF5615 family PIN-like protein [Aphanizomenon sp. CS-733/32]